MGHQAQERAYRPEEPKGSPPPPRRSLYPAAAVRRVSTDTRGRSNEIKTLPMIRIRLASAPGRCYISDCRMHARRRGRAPTELGSRGAEGATAPETLRQKDCGCQGALESGGRDSPGRPPKE